MREQNSLLRELHQLAEQLITDADYDDTVAEKIFEQLRDFDNCWNETSERISHRKDQVSGLCFIQPTSSIIKINVVEFILPALCAMTSCI